MSKTAVVTTRLDAKTLELVDQIATESGRSRSWFAARAIKMLAEEETAFRASLDEADAAIDRGEYHTQAEMEAWFAAKVKARSTSA
jgi:predicted transcriptional regulator